MPSDLQISLYNMLHVCVTHRRMVPERPADTKVLRPQVPYMKLQETTERWEDWPGPLSGFKASGLELHGKTLSLKPNQQTNTHDASYSHEVYRHVCESIS